MQVQVSVGTILKTLLFIGLFCLLYYVKDAVIILLTAIVISSSIEPAVRWLMGYRLPRTLSVILMYVLLVVLFFAGVYIVVPPLLRDSIHFVSNLDQVKISAAFHRLGLLSNASTLPVLDQAFSFQDIANALGNFLTNFSGGTFSTASGIFGSLFSLSIIAILSFYLSVLPDGVGEFLKVTVPVKHQKYVVDLWDRSQRKIGLWMQGQLFLGLVVGVLVYIGLTILGVQDALVLAFLAAVLELIPLFGPILAAVPGVIIAFAQGGISLGVLAVLAYFLIQQTESNVIYPLVVNKVVGLSPVVVIMALLIGGQLGGVLGMLLAVPLVAGFMEFYEDFRRNRLQKLDPAL